MRGLWSGVIVGACVLGLAAAGGLGALYYHRAARPEHPASPWDDGASKADGDGACPVLDDPEKVYLWDIEHHGNLLVKYGFKPFAEALRKGDRTALRAALATEFAGQTLDQPRAVRMEDEVTRVVRLEDAGAPPRRLGPDEFLDELLAYRRGFANPPKVQMALMGFAPVRRDDLDGAWQGAAMLRMWTEKQSDPPREVTLFVAYRVAKPSVATLKAGGWLATCAVTQSQVAQASRWLLRDVTADRRIEVGGLHDNWKVDPKHGRVTSGGVYLCDFNRDGIMDMLVTDANRFALYQGQPDGSFVDVTRTMRLPERPMASTPVSGIAAFVDVDGDGWEDLILGGHFYRNDHGKAFVLTPVRPSLPPDTIGLAVADYDRDGKLDLYVIQSSERGGGSWMSGKAGVPRPNRLWRNLGDWKFEDVTDSAGGVDGGGRSTFTALWLDANNDGWPDLYVPNEFGNGVLYVNQGDGTFKARALVDEPCDFGTMGLIAGDIDNDGNIDLYCANMYSKAGSRVIGNLRPDAYPSEIMAKMRRFVTGSQLHRNLGGLKFEQLGSKYQVAAVGWAYGAALVDLDNDGFLDLYATAGYISRDRNEPDG